MFLLPCYASCLGMDGPSPGLRAELTYSIASIRLLIEIYTN